MIVRFLNMSEFIYGFMTRALMPLVAVSVLANVGSAQHFFNFVEDGSGDLIVTLELFDLPADSPSDISSLTFSATGNSLYGFGQTYSSDFALENGSKDPAFAPTLSVVDGELRSTNSLIVDLRDVDTGFTTINPDPLTSSFSLEFPPVDGTRSGLLNYEGRPNSGGGVTRRTFGTWQLVQAVPEPSAATLLLAIGGVCSLARSRRRRAAA